MIDRTDNGNNNTRIAAILAYCLIIANTIFNLIIAPQILKSVGNSQYGVYKTIGSITSALATLDLGIGQTVVRFISKYNAEKKKEKINSFFSQMIIITAIIIVAIIVVSMVLEVCVLPNYYANFTDEESELASTLFYLMIGGVVVTVFNDFVSGIIAGFNNYKFVNIIKLIGVIIKIVAIYFSIQLSQYIVTVVAIEVISYVIVLVINVMYLIKTKMVKFEFVGWEGTLLKTVFTYTMLMFIQTLIDQVNSNLDNIIIGAVVGTMAVSIYSFGLQIFHMFQQISLAISSVMMPTVMNLVVKEKDNREIEDCIINVGRIQYTLLGCFLGAFVIYGRDFVNLWLGKEYMSVWIIALILMIAGMIPLVENVAISVLRAKNYMVFRTVLLFCMAIINFIMTIILVKKYGYIYAAVATAIGFVLMNTLIMNIYYYIRLKLNVLRILGSILVRRSIYVILTVLISLGISKQLFSGDVNWGCFILECIIYVLIYGVIIGIDMLINKRINIIRRNNHD